MVQKKAIDLGGARRVHFIGIGGISMSGLAEILAAEGFVVTGSDDKESENTARLRQMGVKVSVPTAADNVPADTELVVYTAAIRVGNAEYDAASASGVKMINRAQLIGEMLKAYSTPICVSGTHGKTTTTSMLAEVLLAAGLDPTIMIGGHMLNGNTNFRVGGGHFLLEACEYSGSFLHWQPHVGIVLNIEADHLDFFGNMEKVVEAFAGFARNIRPDGVLIINSGTEGYEEVKAAAVCRVITFGMEDAEGYHPQGIAFSPGSSSFDIYKGTEHLAQISLPMPGRYNIENALATFVAAHALGVPASEIAAALGGVHGARRRFEHKGTTNGIDIIDDYAHHPTEIRECLAAARAGRPQGRIIAVFQPHTYTRTRNHFDDFAAAFKTADHVIFVPIFAAREPYDPTISSEMLCEAAKAHGTSAFYAPDFYEACSQLASLLESGDLLMTIGAGDVYKIGEFQLKGPQEKFLSGFPQFPQFYF
jgi:UDP-N-acetylmuramate--alanine ligase